LVAFFVLRGYAGYLLDFVTNTVLLVKTYNYLKLLCNFYN